MELEEIVAGKESTPEEISAAVNQTIADAQTYCTQGMDPLSFYNVVKNNSTNSDVILSGGYTDAATQADFLPAEGEGTNTATKTAGELHLSLQQETRSSMLTTKHGTHLLVIAILSIQ